VAAFSGGIAPSSLSTQDPYHLADALSALGVDYWPPHASLGDAGPTPTVLTDRLPVAATPFALGGAGLAASYSDDWYRRVHVRPNPLALGNLLSSQVREVEVWNAHFAGKLLSAVNGSNTDGLVLAAPADPPTTFGPLESRLYSLRIANSGAPQIDAAYAFAFPGETPVLRIAGSRVTIWKARPNWKREVIERWQWLTDVLTAYDNSEQRVKLRAKPRREYEFQVTAFGRERQEMENALWGWQHRLFAVPIWQDRRQLLSGAAAGGTALSLDTSGTEFEAGGLAVLTLHDGLAEAQEILAVAPGSLALKLPLQNLWPSGAYVYPARLGRIGARQALTRLTGDVAELVVNFRFDDAGTLGAPDTYPAYRGLPVLEDAPNWAGSLEAEFVHKIAEFDYQTGPAFVEYEGAVPNRLQQFRWFLNGRAAVDRYRRMLGALSGRLTPFWFPSQTSDFTVTQPIGANATQITVRNTGYAQYARQQNGRKDIRIQLRNGAIHYRRLTDAAILSDAEENLQIDSALGSAAIQPDDIRQVSFLSLVRLDQDQVEIAWRTAAFAESSHTVRTLHYDV